ncbi:MAG: hypothetical protein J6W28_08815 [Clostridia bacterium]|nr:hypothetical protein [Clostridia bacterium]
MKKAEWIKILEAEVEKRFDPSQVNGFENSAPAIKLGILAEMYEEEEDADVKIEKAKEQAYEALANTYTVESAWN